MFSNYIIKEKIKEKITEGKNKFIIYPFGDNGLITKTILHEYFGLLPLFIVDNVYAEYNPSIITLEQLKTKYDNSMYIILTVENNKINMMMQNELLDFADIDNIINLKAEEQNAEVEKQRTLIEYIINTSNEYSEAAKKLIYANYKNKNVIKIFSHTELNELDCLCYDFVKTQLEKESEDINSINNIEKTILFFAPLFESFWTNILPLFREYIRKGHKCVVMFRSIDNFWWTGENLNRILYVMREIKNENGQCVLYDNCSEFEGKFKICFFCSEYSVDNPQILKRFCSKLVAVQTTGIYKHIYKSQISISKLYDELKSIDYYVGSDYICDWINRNNNTFEDKMLKVGYPKMDTLHANLSKMINIPVEWLKVTDQKKVILLTMENPEDFIEIFSKYPHMCFVWRPDPEFMGTKSCNEKIEKLKSKIKYLIIDENRTYINAFNISTAMIGMAIFAVPINYIFTNKPLLLLDGELNMYHQCISLEYQEEAWYKACYIADNSKEIENFINMIDSNENYFLQEQKPYRDIMMKNYDGGVCDRVYQVFNFMR